MMFRKSSRWLRGGILTSYAQGIEQNGCAAFHSRRESISGEGPTSFPEDTSMPNSGFEPDPPRLQAECHNHHTGEKSEEPQPPVQRAACGPESYDLLIPALCNRTNECHNFRKLHSREEKSRKVLTEE
ncbi:hypothetical protein TNCV_642121 [Trichonephila clavipes]|nr:hypothetical protein TNCV_642121 [Trichonephila clavipes]